RSYQAIGRSAICRRGFGEKKSPDVLSEIERARGGICRIFRGLSLKRRGIREASPDRMGASRSVGNRSLFGQWLRGLFEGIKIRPPNGLDCLSIKLIFVGVFSYAWETTSFTRARSQYPGIHLGHRGLGVALDGRSSC